jgi:hypothetical protein
LRHRFIDLNELLVSSGLLWIYGTRTPLPDRRDSREYLAHLHVLENEAKAAKRGGWSMVQPWSIGKSSLSISAKRWELGCSAIDSNGRTIWIVDAHRDGKRFVVRADEILTAFLEAERAIHQFAVSLLS